MSLDEILNMLRSSLAIIIVVVVLSVVNGQASLPDKLCDKMPVNNCNCYCNLHQDPRIIEAIKALEAKVERFITVANQTSPRTPFKTPGKTL